MGLVVKNLVISGKGKFSIGLPSIITDGVVLYLDAANPTSYPGTGTTWYDLSGYGNNGFLSGGTSFDSNLKTLVFDGINDFVEVIHSQSLDITGNLTLSAWVFITGVNNFASGIISKGYGPQFSGDILYGGYSIHHRYPDYQLWFEIDNINNSSGNQRKSLQPINTANLNAINPNQPVGPPSTRWHNVVCTFNGTTMEIYLDSVSLGTLNPGTTIGSTPMNVWIGRLHTGGGQSWYWKGYIPHIMIYNKSLTTSEIQQNYNAIKGRFGL